MEEKFKAMCSIYLLFSQMPTSSVVSDKKINYFCLWFSVLPARATKGEGDVP